MGSALRPKFIIGVGDAGRHGLAGRMGHLIQQHRFRGFAPDILIAALGKGIGIQHQVVFVMLGFEQILHGAQLIIRQGPVYIRFKAVVVKRTGDYTDARLGQLRSIGFRHSGVGHKGCIAVLVFLFCADKADHNAAVEYLAAQVGIAALAVALQCGKGCKDQVHSIPHFSGKFRPPYRIPLLSSFPIILL